MNSFIITDVRIYTGEQTIESGSVLVHDGLIVSVGADVAPPSTSIPVISKPGHTLLPGLIDAHVHTFEAVVGLEQSIRFGVTTIMDMHNTPRGLALMKKVARERQDVADFKCACYGATIDGGWPIPVVKTIASPEELEDMKLWPRLKTAEDADAFVEQNIKDGADYIKLMQECGKSLGFEVPHASEALQAEVVKAAKRRGQVVVAHATCLEDTLIVLRAGADGTTHTFFDQPITEEVLSAYQKNNAWCNPTLATCGSSTAEGQPLAQSFASDKRVTGLLTEESKVALCRCHNMAAPTSKVEYAYDSVRQLKAAGIDIICGSDVAFGAPGLAFGISVHHELNLLVHECGFTPAEALRSATSLTARRFGFSDRGELTPGRKADLLLVEGNPMEDISATLNIRAVWRDGIKLQS